MKSTDNNKVHKKGLLNKDICNTLLYYFPPLLFELLSSEEIKDSSYVWKHTGVIRLKTLEATSKCCGQKKGLIMQNIPKTLQNIPQKSRLRETPTL